jgi:hypothetical protein
MRSEAVVSTRSFSAADVADWRRATGAPPSHGVPSLLVFAAALGALSQTHPGVLALRRVCRLEFLREVAVLEEIELSGTMLATESVGELFELTRYVLHASGGGGRALEAEVELLWPGAR